MVLLMRRLFHAPTAGALLCLSWLLASCGNAAVPLPPCYVEVPLYDARGNRLSYRVVAVTPEDEKSVNLLTFPQPQDRITAVGERLYFSERWVGGRRIEITLKAGTGRTVMGRIALMGCQQRTSLEDGWLDTGLDVPTSTVRGRFTGCRIAGDWWVSAMPMFHGQESPMLHEGFIRSDGVFWITSSMTGQRHIIVVGRGKSPVKAFAADVVTGGAKIELGDIDLSAACPK
jgi:hypothetical protein